MTKEKAIYILNRLIDDLIDLDGIFETLKNLMCMGVTDEELLELGFSQDNINLAREDLEEIEEE